MIELLVASASTTADDIDFVFDLVFWIVTPWFFATQGMFLWLLWRFRYREGVPAQYITGNEPHLKRWITWPHALIILCDVAIVAGAVHVWYVVKQEMPDPDVTVRIVSQQWAWSFVHPGTDGQLDTADDIRTVDTLHVEVDKLHHFQLESRDVLHSLSVPAFRLKQDAIPGRVIRGWFEPTLTGSYDLQCAEICGVGHGLMPARVVVETPEEHAAWIAGQASS